MIALPIAAVIGGFKVMKDYFSSTAERAIELKSTLTGLKGIFDDLKTSMNRAIEESGFDKFLGNLTQGFVKQIGGAKAETRYITREVLEESRLQAQRQLKFLETDYAKSEIRIQQLRTQAKQKDKYDTEERTKFLEEALQIEKDYTEKRVTLLTKVADATEALNMLSLIHI